LQCIPERQDSGKATKFSTAVGFQLKEEIPRRHFQGVSRPNQLQVDEEGPRQSLLKHFNNTTERGEMCAYRKIGVEKGGSAATEKRKRGKGTGRKMCTRFARAAQREKGRDTKGQPIFRGNCNLSENIHGGGGARMTGQDGRPHKKHQHHPKKPKPSYVRRKYA